MGIFVESVSLNPQNITPPRVALTVTYKGFVDVKEDNPVTITMELQNGTKVYIAETAISTELKSYNWKDDFPIGASAVKTKNLFVGIDPADAGGVCTVTFTFQPASGGPPDLEQTHFNY